MTQPSDPWLLNGKEAGVAVEEKRTFDTLQLTFRVDATTYENVHLPLLDEAKTYERIPESDGGYRTVADEGTTPVTVTPPAGQQPPRVEIDAYVTGWESTRIEQGDDKREVSVEFTPVSNRTEEDVVKTTRASHEWAFAFPAVDGAIATPRVRYDPSTADEDGADTAALAVILQGDDLVALEGVASRLDAVSLREVPDGPNRYEDNSPGYNVVDVTTPDGTAAGDPIPDGEWVVVEWESVWLANDTYRVDLTIGQPYANIDTSPVTSGPQSPTTGTSPDAEAGPVIDGFEDQDLVEYDTATGDGKAAYDVVQPGSTPTVDGDYYARCRSYEGDSKLYATPGTGTDLDNYPQKGQQFSVWSNQVGDIGTGAAADQLNAWIFFGGSGPNDCYVANLSGRTEEVRLYERSAGSDTTLASDLLSMTSGAWHEIRVTWDDGATFGGSDGDIIVEVLDDAGTVLRQISANSTTYGSGGFGWRMTAASDELNYLDAAIITDEGNTGGSVTYTSMIDSYEDQSMSEYEDIGAGASAIEFTTSPVRDGSYAAVSQGKQGEQFLSTTGLDIYPQQGDEWEYWVYMEGTIGSGSYQHVVYFGVQDTNNHYYIDVRYWNDEIRLHKDGNYVENVKNVGMVSGEWHRVHVQWDDGNTFGGVAGDITITLEDSNANVLAQFSANDTAYTEGGWGHWVDSREGERVIWDKTEILNREVAVVEGSGEMIDDFEDADLVEYEDDFDHGGISEFDIVQSPVYSGTYGVALGEVASGDYPKMLSTSGLQSYPVRGEEFSFWVRPDDGAVSGTETEMGMYFGATDLNNNYYARFQPYNDTIRLFWYNAGTSTAFAKATGVGISGGAWHKCRIQWDDGATFGGVDGEITLIVEDSAGNELARCSGDPTADADYSSGGVGFFGHTATSGEWLYWDFATIGDVTGDGGDGGGGGGGGGGDTTTNVIDDFDSQSFSAYSRISDDGEQAFVFTEDPSAVTTDPIGGGPGYPATVPRSAADWEVSTLSELENAAANAADGDVIYVIADIDTTSATTIDFNSRVTLASNRGIDGQPGHKIIDTSSTKNRFYEFHAPESRITGLQVVGPYPDQWSPDLTHKNNFPEDWHHKGVILNARDIEVDNCHIRGFGYANVQCITGEARPHVHHNNIHHGISEGWGYGVDTANATDVLIEYNRFAHCRHSIVAAGGGSYTARHNIVEEPHGSNVYDMHQDGGLWTEVYRNTIASWDGDIDGRPTHWSDGYTSSGPISGYIQRHNPDDKAHVYSNWMFNELGVYDPDRPRSEGFDPDAIDQAWPEMTAPDPLQWVGVDFHDNHFGGASAAPFDTRATDTRRCHSNGGRALAYLGLRKTLGYLSTSGLDRYPQAGDTFRFFFRWDGTQYERGLAQVFFGVQSETAVQDFYELEFHPTEIRLEVDDAGSDTSLLTLSENLETGFPYEVVVDWPSDPANNGISITLTNVYSGTQVASGTATPDATWTSGGIGFYGFSHCGFLLDDFEVIA